MKHILPLVLLFLVSTGCMSQQHATRQPVNKPTNRELRPPGPYEKQAWHHFQTADYARALQLAYRATAVDPEAPGPALLTGLIYDRVFDRPDLALLEYDRLQHLSPPRPELEILELRLQHLFRRAQSLSASQALEAGSSLPLCEFPLAIVPFQIWGTNNTHKTLSLGLMDLLAYDLTSILGDDQMPTLRLHALRHAYENAFPNANGVDFAKWAGATHTLVGELAPQNEHLIVVSSHLVDKNGQTVYELPQFTLAPSNLPHFRRIILSEIALYLNLPLPPSFDPQPASSVVALGLHAQGLNAYLSGDMALAAHFFEGALAIDPKARLFTSRLQWVQNDLQGALYLDTLPQLYHQLLTRPLPEVALERRLSTTHALLAPDPGIETGTETLSPYKPPQPGGNP